MLVHLNGRLVPVNEAKVSVFDRGFLFGDGIYEGIRTEGGVIVGYEQHLARMRQGMEEMRLDVSPHAFDPSALDYLTTELLEANGLRDAAVYWQVTRGTPGPGEPLRQRTPGKSMRPTVFGYAIPAKPAAAYIIPEVRKASLRPDTRWTRGHLKSIALVGGVLAAIEAEEAGCDDAILYKGDLLTEGTATNVLIVPKGGDHVVTPSLTSAPMLAGVTRILLMEADPTIEERPVTVEELLTADEIMLAGTYTMVAAITRLDGRPVGDAAARNDAPGPWATKMLRTLVSAIQRDVHSPRHA